MRMTLLVAAALIAAPALAQDTNNAADANTVAVVPDANAADANAVAIDPNAVAPLPPATTEPMPVETAPAPEPADDDDGIPWGLVGLVGLIGLLGRKRS